MTAALILAAALAVMAVVQTVCARIDARKFPAPGRLVDTPSARMHVSRSGQGWPPVVLEAGIAASSLSWSLAQPLLALANETYSYDRAGFGWSTAQNQSFSLAKIVEDLHDLVVALKVRAPYILVAHSFGGYIATAYAQRYAVELAGVVLVDPLTPEEWVRPDRTQHWMILRGIWFSRAGALLARLGVLRFCLWLLQRGNLAAPRGVLRIFGAKATETVERILRELTKLPPEVVRLIRARWSTPKFFRSMAAYIQALPRCAAELEACSIPGEVPVTVLSGAHQPEVRLREHAAIAAHSIRGRHLMANKSAHWIHLDQPELVAEAVREMAAGLPFTMQVRSQRP